MVLDSPVSAAKYGSRPAREDGSRGRRVTTPPLLVSQGHCYRGVIVHLHRRDGLTKTRLFAPDVTILSVLEYLELSGEIISAQWRPELKIDSQLIQTAVTQKLCRPCNRTGCDLDPKSGLRRPLTTSLR